MHKSKKKWNIIDSLQMMQTCFFFKEMFQVGNVTLPPVETVRYFHVISQVGFMKLQTDVPEL